MADNKESVERSLNEFKLIYEGILNKLKKSKKELDDSFEDIESMPEADFKKHQNKVERFVRRVNTFETRVKKDIFAIRDQVGREKFQYEFLQDIKSQVGGLVVDGKELAKELDNAVYNRKNAFIKFFSKAPVNEGEVQEDDVSRFSQIRKDIAKLQDQAKTFAEKNERLEKSEYFGLRKIEMNLDDLDKLRQEVKVYADRKEKSTDQLIRLAAVRLGTNVDEIRKNLYEIHPDILAPTIQGNQENRKKFPGDLWFAIEKLNDVAAHLNVVYKAAREKMNTTEDKIKKLSEAEKRLAEADAKLKEEIRAKINVEVKKERDALYEQTVGNASALAQSRMLYASLTPAEAEQLRRKQAFFDELRVQQAVHDKIGTKFNLGENVLSIFKMGSVKAKQFTFATWEGAKEVVNELGSQSLHVVDMILAAPIAIPVKLINASATFLTRLTAVPGVYGFEKPRDAFLKDTEDFAGLTTGDKAKKVAKWVVIGIITSPITIIGASCRGISKAADFVRQGVDFDRWVKNSRGFATAASSIGGLLIIALSVAAPFTLGFSLIPLAAIGIGLAVSSAYSARRAVAKAANVATEATNLKLSEEDSIRLALYDYDNPSGEHSKKENQQSRNQAVAAGTQNEDAQKPTPVANVVMNVVSILNPNAKMAAEPSQMGSSGATLASMTAHTSPGSAGASIPADVALNPSANTHHAAAHTAQLQRIQDALKQAHDKKSHVHHGLVAGEQPIITIAAGKPSSEASPIPTVAEQHKIDQERADSPKSNI